MKNALTLGTLAASLLVSSSAMAGIFGADITLQNDGNSTSKSWEGKYEDQETEPGTVHSQAWDLEGMFLNGTKLTLVGGYDFKNGYGGTTSGDVFVDIDGNAQFGSTNTSLTKNSNTTNLSGYDLVLDLNFSSMTFDVIKLVQGASVVRTGTDIAGSNPWKWVSGGDTLYSGLGFTYISGLTNSQTGFQGGSHYAITLDVSFLSGSDATFHNTMSCGNDNLMGRAHVPDAAATLSLFGAALVGLVGFRRFMMKA